MIYEGILNDKEILLTEKLNEKDKDVRLNSLQELFKNNKLIEIYNQDKKQHFVNNHIHTTYSFSPYSPTKSVWMAYNTGLTTAGIMDHESLGGAIEFKKAGKIANIATTVGVELRADFSKTKLKDKKINHPDQKSVAYVAIHGIPQNKVSEADTFFSKYRKRRNERNKLMVNNINNEMNKYGIEISFENDIIPVSNFEDSGTITERHILFGLVKKIIKTYGKGEKLLRFLKDDLNLKVSEKINGYLKDTENPHYEYDLLGLFKSDLLEKIYIDATEECPDIKEVVTFAKSIGGILAYAYLGDVGDSATGDKKTQKFEDDYLDELVEEIKNIGFNAITYMPSRNSLMQLERLRNLADKNNLFQISGEDINSSRQSFICKELENPIFNNLIDSTWALIGHETESEKGLEYGMFSKEIVEKFPKISDRILYFVNKAK
jgi:predicted metal-dependent phosphoesterase TrpH